MAVPKLRFKEFDGDWDLKNLGDCFSLFSGYAFPSSASVDNGTKWLKIADVGIQEMTPNNLSFLPNNFTTKFPQFIVSKNDYVIALTRPILNKKLKIAKVGEFYDGALLNQRVAKIVSENNNLDFIYSLLQKSKTVEELENSIAGTDPPNLSLNEVKGIVLGIPKVEEQTKIASFLSAVDEKINQLTQKHELLSQYKQGMMQKLFSQQIRFKADDGSEFGEWTYCNIGSFLKVKSGLGFKAEEYTTEEEVRLLQIENVGYGSVKWTHNVKYVPQSYLKLHQDLVLKEGDLVLALNRPVTNNKLKIAKLTRLDTPSILYQRVGKLELKHENLDRDFIFQIFQKEVKSYVLNSSIGSDQPFISTTDLYKHYLMLPSKEEQTKIANFLSAIDQKIEVVAQQIEQAKQWKKGLLQQMFV